MISAPCPTFPRGLDSVAELNSIMCIRMCMCIYIYIYILFNVYIYIYIYNCICLCVCVYIYIYIYRERERETSYSCGRSLPGGEASRHNSCTGQGSFIGRVLRETSYEIIWLSVAFIIHVRVVLSVQQPTFHRLPNLNDYSAAHVVVSFVSGDKLTCRLLK